MKLLVIISALIAATVAEPGYGYGGYGHRGYGYSGYGHHLGKRSAEAEPEAAPSAEPKATAAAEPEATAVAEPGYGYYGGYGHRYGYGGYGLGYGYGGYGHRGYIGKRSADAEPGYGGYGYR